MTNKFTVSCVQTNTGASLEANLKQIEELMHQAHKEGADFIALPEVCDVIHPDKTFGQNYAKPMEETYALKFISALAAKLKTHVLIGSITVRHEEGRLANRAFLISPTGQVITHYDKIHMFDADVPGEKNFKESDNYHPGENAVITDLPWCKMGLSICYDLRFPALFRKLAHAGAELLAVPAAFTMTTGKAHWECLLRARAIENTCFVIAPAQTGHHYDSRYSYGHSVIISPWGEILADGGEGVGVITAEIDLDDIAKSRAVISSIHHDRSFSFPQKEI